MNMHWFLLVSSDKHSLDYTIYQFNYEHFANIIMTNVCYIHSYQYIIHTFKSLFTFRNTYWAIMTHPSRHACAETICVSTCLAVRRTNVRTVRAIVTFLTYWNRKVDTNINKEMKNMTSYRISL